MIKLITLLIEDSALYHGEQKTLKNKSIMIWTVINSYMNGNSSLYFIYGLYSKDSFDR